MSTGRTNLGTPPPPRPGRRSPSRPPGSPPKPPVSVTSAGGSDQDPDEECPVLRTGFGDVTVQVVYVTPKVARKLLDSRHVELQRNLRRKTLRKLTDDLESGRFKFNGQSIVRDQDGKMIDGQTRCTAIEQSGVGAFVLVVSGVESTSYKTIDGGEARRIEDVIKGAGHINSRLIGGIVTLIWRYERGNLLGTETPSNPHVEDLINAHPGVGESIIQTTKAGDKMKSQAAAAFFHYVFAKIHRPLSDDFFYRLGTGEDLKKGNPVLTLRNWLESYDEPDRKVRMFSFVVKAWNAVRKNRELGRLTYNPDEQFPEII